MMNNVLKSTPTPSQSRRVFNLMLKHKSKEQSCATLKKYSHASLSSVQSLLVLLHNTFFVFLGV